MEPPPIRLCAGARRGLVVVCQCGWSTAVEYRSICKAGQSVGRPRGRPDHTLILLEIPLKGRVGSQNKDPPKPRARRRVRVLQSRHFSADAVWVQKTQSTCWRERATSERAARSLCPRVVDALLGAKSQEAPLSHCTRIAPRIGQAFGWALVCLTTRYAWYKVAILVMVHRHETDDAKP